MRTHKIKQQKSKSKETTKQINAFSTFNNKAVQNQHRGDKSTLLTQKKAGSQTQKFRKYTKIKRYKHKYREKTEKYLTNST